MSMRGRIPILGLAVAVTALAASAGLWLVARPAAALPRAGICLPILQTCPTTPKTVTTTKAPTTTVATPTTSKAVRSTASTTAARTATAATTTTTRKASTQPAIGAGALPATAALPNDLSGLGAGVDPAAPQLAAPAPPGTTASGVVPLVLPGLVGTTARGLPDDHAAARIALSGLVLLIALVAAAQLPKSRRSPRPKPDPLG